MTDINEILKIHDGLETIYKLLPTVDFKDLKVGAEYGLAFSANNSQYYYNVTVTVVNPKSARVKTNEGGVFVVNKKTIKNRLFDFKEYTLICEELNNCERAINSYVSGKISEFWKERIDKMEQERKEQGVYTAGTLYKIDFNYPGYLRKVADNKEISA